jgi:hypothetical protein
LLEEELEAMIAKNKIEVSYLLCFAIFLYTLIWKLEIWILESHRVFNSLQIL